MHFPGRRVWTEGTTLVDSRVRPIRLLWTLVRVIPPKGVAIMDGSGRKEQVLAALLRRLRPDARIVLADCTWQGGVNPLDRFLGRRLVRALQSPHTTFCVLSRAEAASFPGTWGVPADRVAVTAWYHGLTEKELDDVVRSDG